MADPVASLVKGTLDLLVSHRRRVVVVDERLAERLWNGEAVGVTKFGGVRCFIMSLFVQSRGFLFPYVSFISTSDDLPCLGLIFMYWFPIQPSGSIHKAQAVHSFCIFFVVSTRWLGNGSIRNFI